MSRLTSKKRGKRRKQPDPEPEPHMLDMVEVADLVGLSHARISQFVSAGKLTMKADKFECKTFISEWSALMRERTDGSALKHAKWEKQNELLEIELIAARKESMPVSDVERAWSDIILRVRDRFRRIGSKLAPRMTYCKSEIQMEKLINDEVDEVLTELSRSVDYKQEAPAQ